MDLISREAVKEQAKASYHVAESMEQLGNLYEDCINALPSAFEGMTFGEVFKSVFANYIGGVYVGKDYVEVAFNDIKAHISYYPTEVWDSPYKGVSE